MGPEDSHSPNHHLQIETNKKKIIGTKMAERCHEQVQSSRDTLKVRSSFRLDDTALKGSRKPYLEGVSGIQVL